MRYIDYYMLRAWYGFYSRVFNTISRTSESSSEWAVWYQKRVNKNDIRLLACNNLFIRNYLLKKNQAPKLKYKKALTKLQSNSSRQIRRQASAKIQNITCKPIGPTKLWQSFWLDNSNPWSDMISFHSVKWYHITSRVSFLLTALSHWYPHTICIIK